MFFFGQISKGKEISRAGIIIGQKHKNQTKKCTQKGTVPDLGYYFSCSQKIDYGDKKVEKYTSLGEKKI